MLPCPRPKCKGPSSVTDSRLSKKLFTIVRRRKCLRCHTRWSTIEIAMITFGGLKRTERLVQELTRHISH